MFQKAKIFSLGIMHIYTLAYIVYILRERVTFSRLSSTYSQPFNKWHIQIKSLQLYLGARLGCFSHFIRAFNNNKFSWSLAIHCYQLWGIRDIEQTRKTGAKNQDRSSLEQRPIDKRSSKIAGLCHRGHPNIWSGRQSTAGAAPVPIRQDSPPRGEYTPIKSSPRTSHLPATDTSALPWAAERSGTAEGQHRRRRGEGEKRGLRAEVRDWCTAQTTTFHFDNLITQLQLATEKRTEIQRLKEIPFFPNFKGFPATWRGGYRKKGEKI